jgi:hypothetical protein
MYCGENQCRKIMKGPIECSPQVKLWIRPAVFSTGSSVTNYLH